MTNHYDDQTQRNQAVLEALAARQQTAPPSAPWATPGSPGVAVEQTPLAPSDALQVPWAQDPQTGERPSRWPLAAWVLIDAVLAFGLTLLLTFAATILWALVSGIALTDLQQLIKDPYYFFTSIALQSISFVIIVVVRIVVLRRLPLSWLGVHQRGLPSALGWGVVAGFVFLGVNIGLGSLFDLLGSSPDQAAQFPTEGANGVQMALLGIGIAVFAPLVEELFFRGYALRAFTQRLGPRWGLVLSAALFAGPHVFGITTGFIGLLVPIFFGGLILGYVYQRTGSLWSAVVAHAINNGAAFLALLFFPNA